MSIHRYGARTDANKPAIVQALRAAGCRCSVPPWLPCEHTWEPPEPELEPEQVEHLRSIRYDAG